MSVSIIPIATGSRRLAIYPLNRRRMVTGVVGFGVAAIAISPPIETESEPDREAATEPTDQPALFECLIVPLQDTRRRCS